MYRRDEHLIVHGVPRTKRCCTSATLINSSDQYTNMHPNAINYIVSKLSVILMVELNYTLWWGTAGTSWETLSAQLSKSL